MKAFFKPITTLFGHAKPHPDPKAQSDKETQSVTSNMMAQPQDPELVQKVARWLTALGGSANISQVEACALTRLRIKLNNNDSIDKEMLKNEGVEAIVQIDDHLIHLLVGLNAEHYASEMRAQITK